MKANPILCAAFVIWVLCSQASSQDKAKTQTPQAPAKTAVPRGSGKTTATQVPANTAAQVPANTVTRVPTNAATPQTAANVATRNGAEALAEYIIGPEDVLGVSVWREPELTARVAVRPDGKIDLPLVNDIKASGLTTRQLREVITENIRKFVPDPTV